jgi:hypothetical protein
MDNSAEKQKAPSGRVTRTPLGKRNILSVKGQDPNYEYRFVNEVEDRISQFQEAGYEIVPDTSATVGDKRVNATSSIGSGKQVSVGQGTKAYLMRIKKEYYEEDQATKMAHVNEIERATKEQALNGNYGKIEITRD